MTSGTDAGPDVSAGVTGVSGGAAVTRHARVSRGRWASRRARRRQAGSGPDGAGKFRDIDRPAGTTQSPWRPVSPRCRFKQMGLADIAPERFGGEGTLEVESRPPIVSVLISYTACCSMSPLTLGQKVEDDT